MAETQSSVSAGALPALSMAQMREVDRIMIEELGIELVQMMENAGRSLASLARDRFDPGRVMVLAGPGGNGGGGMVAARHLANWGVSASVVLGSGRDRLGAVPTLQLDILERLGLELLEEPAADTDLVIDALIGYSLRGDPRGRVAELIAWSNRQASPVLSLDTPSGLDVTTGEPATPCVAAAATLTLVAPKSGLLAAPEVGELYLADISVPPALYRTLGLEMPAGVFRAGTVVRLV